MSLFSSPENFCVLSDQLNRAFHGLKTAFQIALDIWYLYKHLSADSVAQQINKWLSSEWPCGITGLYRKRWEAVAGSSTLQAAAVRCSQGHSTLEGAAFICLHHLRADRQLCPSSPAAMGKHLNSGPLPLRVLWFQSNTAPDWRHLTLSMDRADMKGIGWPHQTSIKIQSSHIRKRHTCFDKQSSFTKKRLLWG